MTEISQKHKKGAGLTTYGQVLKEFQKIRKNTLEETNKQVHPVKKLNEKHVKV